MRANAGKTCRERWYNRVRSGESHALLRLAPLCLARGPTPTLSLTSALPLSLHPTHPAFTQPSIINHLSSNPSIHHSSVHICPTLRPFPTPFQSGHMRSTSISATSRSHLFSTRWIPPLLLHKETLALLQCSIRRCCATALKIPQGQGGGKLKTGYQQSYSDGENKKKSHVGLSIAFCSQLHKYIYTYI